MTSDFEYFRINEATESPIKSDTVFIIANERITTSEYIGRYFTVFPSFKEFKVNKENSFGVLAVGILTLVLIAVKPEVTLFVMCILYMIIGMLFDLHRVIFRREADDESLVAVKSEN